ncbi:MAG: hypothetical protein U9R54_03315, partial [Bacteroidota bacterium]|nr:hypothetical protein [Bacteroidota bacterium]
MKTIIKHIKKIIPFFGGIIFLFFSCTQNEIEKINTITDRTNTPNISVENIKIIYTEFGKTK